MNKLQCFRRFAANWKETQIKNGLSIKTAEVTLPDELYLCPISLQLYAIENLKGEYLTVEHVPPKSLGGRELVLVAKEVNSTDGHTSDKDLLLFFQTRNFIEHGKSLNATISADSLNMKGITTVISLQNFKSSQNDITNVSFVTSQRNLKAMEFKGVFDNWNGLSFKVSGRMSTKLKVKTVLKCAYLTAFSRIGYDLLYDKNGYKTDSYGVILDILNNRKDEHDFPFVCQLGHAPLENTDLGVINTPIHLQALIVNLSFKLDNQFYKYVVFLPHPKSTNLENLHNIAKTAGNVNFNISSITNKI